MTHEPIENINNFSLKIKYLKKIIYYSIFSYSFTIWKH